MSEISADELAKKFNDQLSGDFWQKMATILESQNEIKDLPHCLKAREVCSRFGYSMNELKALEKEGKIKLFQNRKKGAWRMRTVYAPVLIGLKKDKL